MPGHCHVWRLAPANHPLPAAAALLDEAEYHRAGRFHFAENARVYVNCRAALRTLLARYTGVKACELRFAYGENGKPRLAGHAAAAGGAVRFNVSHSHGVALLAFSRDGEMGIDLEWEARDFDPSAVVGRFFTPPEKAAILGRSGAARYRYFYRAWTRKEAVLKWAGTGLSTPLDRFAVAIKPEDSVEVTWHDWPGFDPAGIQLVAFTCGERLPGAACLPKSVSEIDFLDFQPRWLASAMEDDHDL